MSVMKPYLMTITILLILVQKTPGGLFRSNNNKKKETWNPCELYQGKCRNTCRNYEVRYFSCLPDLKCCLKLSSDVAGADSDSRKEDSSLSSNLSSSLSVTNMSSYAPS
uniref:Beta-defensin n=1 Tax=Sciurus vulgaris TaxID=55149 RepID=A0A8D2AFX8_SCIVU